MRKQRRVGGNPFANGHDVVKVDAAQSTITPHKRPCISRRRSRRVVADPFIGRSVAWPEHCTSRA
jgi:hypothetical protein